MRPPCTFCARKHLAQALVLLQEARQGYPMHRWLAIGHLAEAADELIADDREPVREVAHALRQDRKQLEVNEGHNVPVMEYLQRLCDEEDLPAQAIAPPPSVLNPVGPEFKPPHPQAKLLWRGNLLEHQGMPDFNHVLGKKVWETRDGWTAVWIVPGDQPPVIRDHTVSETRTTAPCTPCEEAKRQRAASLAAANEGIIHKEVAASKESKRPRLMLITTLTDFNPSYSLSTVVLDQANAGIMAGFDVDVLVMEHSNLSQLGPLPSGMSIRMVVPTFPWADDILDEEAASALANMLVKWHHIAQPDLIITHDLVFQKAFCSFAKAFHMIAESLTVPVLHMAHSAPGFGQAPPPVRSAEWYRRTVPNGHSILTCNPELIEPLARYYNCDRERIKVLTNARDIRVWSNMPPLASRIITRLQLHRCDVVQVYPFSITRWREKGVMQLLRSFAVLNQLSHEYHFITRLVLVTCHANGDGEAYAKDLRREIESLGLQGMVHITSDLWPDTAAVGLPGDVVQALFSVSNLFLFPTWSEAASLILREAALAGCSLVLNKNVPQLKGCIPLERARWFEWQALAGGPVKDDAWVERERKLLSEVVTELVAPGPASVKRYAMARFCHEAMGETLRTFLPEQPPS